MAHIVAPSILSCDFAHLAQEVQMLNDSKADWVHVDIMDGVFVPNISFGFPVVQAINRYSVKPLNVHLMIVHPERYIQHFKEVGASHLLVHFEACAHLHSTVHAIKEEGMQAGVAINPHTSVRLLEDIVSDIDQVLIMSVNPGFGGQKFIEHTYKKIEQARNLIERSHSKALLGIDGGVDFFNASKLLSVGADILVAGSAVFKSSHPTETIAALKGS